MFGIIMRIKMRFCLNKIEKQCFNDETGVISGDDINKLCSTPKKLKVLLALEASECICITWADGYNHPLCIREGKRASLYVLERSEIWLNRFLGFIAGILTTILADLSINLL